MEKLILVNGKYIPVEILHGRTLPQNVIDMAQGTYHGTIEDRSITLTIIKQYNCIIVCQGAYKFYFNNNGEFSMMLKFDKRLNENFEENNKSLECLMEFLVNSELTRMYSM
ncbi:hypothetical protein [Acinetobacter phage AB1I1M-1]